MKKQQGITLIVALVLLLMMSLIGLTTLSSSNMQKKLAGNQQQKAIARLNAESALRQAENFLEANYENPTEAEIVADFSEKANGHLFISLESALNGRVNDALDDLAQPAVWKSNKIKGEGDGDAEYIIEYIGQMETTNSGKASLNVENRNKVTQNPYVFRVTAIGRGENRDITAILQSTYATRQGVN